MMKCCCSDDSSKDRGVVADDETTKVIGQEEGLTEKKDLGKEVENAAAYSGAGPAETPKAVAAEPQKEEPAPVPVVVAAAAEPAQEPAPAAAEPAKPAAPAPEPVKAAGPGPSAEYTVMISKGPGDAFGLSFDGMENSAVVTEVKPSGLIFKNNQTAAANEKVGVGDSLLQVNGKGGDLKALVEEMSSSDKVSMKFRRMQEWEIKVDKAQGLGLNLAHKESSLALFVGEVNAGAVQNWNKTNPQALVNKGDRILSANGVTGDASKIIGAIQAAKGELTLRFAR